MRECNGSSNVLSSEEIGGFFGLFCCLVLGFCRCFFLSKKEERILVTTNMVRQPGVV